MFLFVPAVLTLGLLFLVMPFIVNTVTLWLTDTQVLASFEIRDTRGLLVSSLVITLVNGVFYAPLMSAVARGYGYDSTWT